MKFQGFTSLRWLKRLSAGVATVWVFGSVVNAAMLSNQADFAGPPASDKLTGSNVCADTAFVSSNQLAAFLDLNQARCRSALDRARSWLDTLEINPIDLRAHGIKGKKKLAELLDVYLRLHDLVSAGDRANLRSRIQRIAAITATPGYHDMLRVTDQQFKEDATSYLRVAFLMDRFGLDTRLYRQEILRVLPRLNAHMQYRGADQRMAFHLYYAHFGLAEPFFLQSAYQTGVIAARRDLAWLKRNKMGIYSLTHEIFVPYEFGAKLDADFFTESDKIYLRPLLADLTAYTIGMDDADLTAELTACLRYLHFTGLPVYQAALEYLLKSQWPDGKWGRYEPQRAYYGNYVNQAFYLHTTLVAVDALTTAFYYRER